MAIKYTNIFHSTKALKENSQKKDFWFVNIPSGNPDFNSGAVSGHLFLGKKSSKMAPTLKDPRELFLQVKMI
jgi:hypothetical protein